MNRTAAVTVDRQPAAPPAISAATLHEGRLICLDGSGRVVVWRASDWQADDAEAARIGLDGLRGIASDGRDLWGVTRTSLVHWSDARRRWIPGPWLLRDEVGENLQGLAVANGRPILVHRRRVVVETAAGLESIPIPLLQGVPDVRRGGLEVDDLFTGRRILWIAAGYGEWGGNLLGLDLASHRWCQYSDRGDYPNGLTGDGAGRLLVSWSMDHMETVETLLRVHRDDATVLRSLQLVRSHDYEKIARSANGAVLYAADVGGSENQLVEVRNGQPVKLASLPERAAHPQRGITRLLPTSDGELVVIWGNLPPLVYHRGRLNRLPFSTLRSS